MSFFRQVVVDIEGVVRDYLVPSNVPAPGKDLPPKYEDVEEAPPTYAATTMAREEVVALPEEEAAPPREEPKEESRA